MNLTLISLDPSVQAHYESMRLEGQSHVLAEMFALQRAPQAKTDREFLEGHCNGNQFAGDPKMGDHYKRIAERHGQSTTGKIYLRSLAMFPGDPRAWVSDRHDVQKVAEERGFNVDGMVTVKSPMRNEPPPPVRMADDLVEEYATVYTEANPDLKKKPRQEVKEMVVDIHGAHS